MMKNKIRTRLLLSCFVMMSSLFMLSAIKQDKIPWIDENFVLAAAKTKAMADGIGDSSRIPVTMKVANQPHLANLYDWRSGFFAGNMWLLHEFSGGKAWLNEAKKWTAALEPLKDFKDHHDLGFMMYCSYGAGYRLTKDQRYKEILVQGARSLCSRFDERTGAIKSWNTFKSWTSGAVYLYPVIIDNMMNLELLFFASKATGDPYYKDIAIKHANTTLKNHFRDDFSAYHVVCYDQQTGAVVAKESAQGYAHASAWARGQAWALYGYTMTYRETGDKNYLNHAKGLATYLMNHPNLPEDKVPNWDYHAGNPAYTPCGANAAKYATGAQPRDASAAAVIASALLELSDYVSKKEASAMVAFAEKSLKSLSSPAYRTALGSNANFLLAHSVGSIPHGGEIDAPLIYADYYFLEALMRLKKRLS